MSDIGHRFDLGEGAIEFQRISEKRERIRQEVMPAVHRDLSLQNLTQMSLGLNESQWTIFKNAIADAKSVEATGRIGTEKNIIERPHGKPIDPLEERYKAWLNKSGVKNTDATIAAIRKIVPNLFTQKADVKVR